MEIFFEEDKKHMQVNDFHAENAESYNDYWQDLRNKYSGYEIDFCYHDCEAPVEFMAKIDATLLEKCVKMQLIQKNFTQIHRIDPIFITNENLITFTILHDKRNPDMYWTSERICRDLSRWCIYIYEENYVMMSLWSDIAEIFALEVTNASDGAVLLSAAAAFAFEAGKESLLMMVDDNSPIEADAARLVGFTECGNYIAYRSIVK